MADVFKAHPEAKEPNALYVLAKVMGIDTSGQGISMPLILGLSLAPFYIVDGE